MTQLDRENAAPSPFSAGNPRLQVAWNSSSLQELQFCPRKYQYTVLDGWKPGSAVDLEFGGYFAAAVERYYRARLAGSSRDDAQLDTLDWLLRETWRDGRPWGGTVQEEWRCSGAEPYKNAKGNKAKCPYSHSGQFFPAPAPDICGECGSAVEVHRNFVADHKTKNRKTLVRAFAWWVEEQPERLQDGVYPYTFPNGTPAIELSGVVPLPRQTPSGENYLLTFHLDQIAALGDELFVQDQKTTTKSLGPEFWGGYSPHMQMDTYDLIVTLLFPDLPIAGILLDAVQTQVGGARFARRPLYKRESQREEQLDIILRVIADAERYAAEDHWPMNKRSCWLCPFKRVCSKPPEERNRYLAADFEKGETLNPLAIR